MPSWRHTLAVARRRAAARAALTTAGNVAPFVAGAALIWTATAAALDRPAHWPVVGAALAITIGAAALIGWLRRPTKLAVASALDRQANLHDAIATALQLSARSVASPLEAQAIADANLAAAHADPARAIPWTLRRPALFTLAAAAMLTGAAFIPACWPAAVLKLAGGYPGPPRAEIQTAVANTQAAEQLIRAVTPPPAPQPSATDANARHTDPLADLRNQLEHGQVSPKEATQQAATAIERAADRLEQRAGDTQAAQDLLRDRLAMAQKASEDKPTTDRVSEFARALQSGDIDKAAAEAERLANAADKLSPADRAKLAEELKQIASDLKQPPSSPVPPSPPPAAPQSSPPQPPSTTPTSAAKPPEPQPSQPYKPQPDKPQTDAGSKLSPQDKANQESEDLADKLQKASDQLSKPEAPQDQPSPRPQDASKPPDTSEQQEGSKPQDAPKPQGGKPSSNPAAKPNESSPQPNAQPKTGDAPQPAQGAEPGSNKQPQPEEARPGDGKQSQQGSTRQPRQEPRPQPGQSGDKPQSGTQPGSGHKPGEQPAGARPFGDKHPEQGQPKPESSPQGEQGQQQPTSKPALDQLRDKLKDLADQRRQPQQDRQDAQKLREQAQKMWDDATPDERRQMEQLARELAKRNPGMGESGKQPPQGSNPKPALQPGGGNRADDPNQLRLAGGSDESRPDTPDGRGPGNGLPGDKPPLTPTQRSTTTQDLDARSNGELTAPSRVIAEWLTNKPAPRTGDGPATPPAAVARALEQSRQNAEQALQQRTVPARLTPLIRRYFERLPQAVGAGGPPAAPSRPNAPTPPAASHSTPPLAKP